MNTWKCVPVLCAVMMSLAGLAAAAPQRAGDPALLALLPEVDGWTSVEAARSFFPDTLYEYINGAAESYIGYDFRELAVGEFKRSGSGTTVTVEIYRMANDTDAFGIYSAERYPDNRTVDVGTHGYIEGEVLNFVQGSVYVKLLCFEGGDETAAILEAFARKVAAAAGARGALPAQFALFPGEGRVGNSEKYVRRNFMGFEDLNNGYTVAYKAGDAEFEGFVVEPSSGADANALLRRLLDFFAVDGQSISTLASGSGHRVRNKYGQNMILGTAAGRLCGMHRVPDGAGATAEALFDRLVEALKKGV